MGGKVKKNKVIGILFDCLKLIVGSFLMACSTVFFLLPNKLSTGGFSGIATIAYYLINIPVGTAMIILNIPLFISAFFRIGKKFIIKSIIGTLLLSVFIDMLEQFHGLTTDRFLACIYGGILMGIRNSTCFKSKWVNWWK